MGQAARDYTTEDAINDYRFWQSGDNMAEAFYAAAPPSRPGAVHDYDYSPHLAAQKRIARMQPLDPAGAVLMLEAVITDLEDEGSGVPTGGLRALQHLIAGGLRRKRGGLLDTARLVAQQENRLPSLSA